MKVQGVEMNFYFVNEDVKYEDVEVVVVRNVDGLAEIEIILFLKDYRNPVKYIIDMNNSNQICDSRGFGGESDERRLRTFLNSNDTRTLVNKAWDYLERDDVIPFIGEMIDNIVDGYDERVGV